MRMFFLLLLLSLSACDSNPQSVSNTESQSTDPDPVNLAQAPKADSEIVKGLKLLRDQYLIALEDTNLSKADKTRLQSDLDEIERQITAQLNSESPSDSDIQQEMMDVYENQNTGL